MTVKRILGRWLLVFAGFCLGWLVFGDASNLVVGPLMAASVIVGMQLNKVD